MADPAVFSMWSLKSLPKESQDLGSLSEFAVEPKPILPPGSWTEKCIGKYTEEINAKIADHIANSVPMVRNRT
jgi:hypothetical protein